MSGRTVPIVFVSLLILAAPALGSSYFLWDAVPGTTWHDVDKTAANTDDDFLCWAAAASNILEWGGWDTAAYNNEALIFQQFQEHWTDQGSWPCYGMDWWLNGTLPPAQAGWAQVDVAGGGNLHPTQDFSDYYYEWIDPWGAHDAASAYLVMGAIDYYLHEGYGMSIGIYTNGGGHALTVWGVEYDGGAYAGLYVTDSDDYVTALQYYPIYWDSIGDYWYFEHNTDYKYWRISAVQALDGHPLIQMVPGLHPILPADPTFAILPLAPVTPVAPLVPPPTPVPAPGAAVLAILGVAATAVARRVGR